MALDDVPQMSAEQRQNMGQLAPRVYAYPWLEPGRYGEFNLPTNVWRRHGLNTTLYFVGDDGPLIKIELARDLDKRLRTFELGNPRIVLRARRTIYAVLDRQVEKMVHAALAPHAAGREWFRVAVKDALAVAKPIIDRAERVYRKMEADGLFAASDEDRLWPR